MDPRRGRKVKELRADGTSTVTAYCVLSGRGLDARANSSTTYGDPISCPTPASGEATADAVAFTHVEPRGANGTKMGPFVRVYTDRLGREIRTVTESFDGSAQRSGFAGALIAKDTAYNAYGAQILQTQPYFLSTGSSTTTGSNDMGVVKTDYDVLGQLVWQQSPNELANGQATTMAYDVLGRLSSRTDPEYTSNWHYDTYADGSACNKGVGKLCESKTTSGIDRKNYYDSYGRPLSSRTDISNGPSFGSAVGYDPTTGRITSQTYPSGLQVGYAYTSRGYQDRLVVMTREDFGSRSRPIRG
ncbi:MAG TPA: hypothetical protein VFP68_20810 [Burkholderiaceae bacterium]|nr:hypothetical protein [Burkholderiaceae bacterium]